MVSTSNTSDTNKKLCKTLYSVYRIIFYFIMDFVVLNFLVLCDIITLKHAATFHQTNYGIYVGIDG
jgi:NDP-sugar pyrophosphorylase family protein